jgi:LysM repeat protein
MFAVLAIISGLLTDGGDATSNTTPDSVQTATTIGAPTTTAVPKEYVVQSGESLYSIAEKFNLSAPALVELNNIKNPDSVSAGTTLLLPPSNGFVPIGATTTMPP